MSQEILYTSAPQGLKSGSRGFCTVHSTAGMAKNLAERLESLSGYRHAFAPHSVDASRNPVNFSHLILTVGGKQFHVLSRVGDAGLDYTHRSNKLAHHVALDPEELTPAGPAWVLAQPDFCVAAWDGETKILTAGRQPTPTLPAAGVCRRWKDIAGDAGWAGVLAASALEPRPQPISVIFRPGMPTLWLVVEAMHLLPPERRWDVTFSTYFTKLPAGVDCQWRFLLDGTPEARAVRRNPHATRIDLCSQLGPAVGGSLVEAARNGTPEPWRKLPFSGSPIAPPVPRPANVATTPEPVTAANAPAGRSPIPPPTPLARLAPPVNDALRQRVERRSRGRGKMLAIAACLSVLVTGGLFAAYYAGTRNAGPFPQTAAPAEDTLPLAANDEQLPIASTLPKVQNNDEPDEQQPRLEERPNESKKRRRKREKPVIAEAPPHRPAVPEPNRPQPLSEIRRLGGRLQLPPRKIGLDGGNRPAQLAKLFLDADLPCELDIVGSDVLLGPGQEFVVEQTESASENVRNWTVVLKMANSLSGQHKIAEFQWKQDALWFQWEPQTVASLRAVPLEFCLLRIQAGGESELCHLSESQRVEPATIDLSVRRQPIEVPLPIDSAIALKHVRFDVAVEGYPHDVELIRNRALHAAQSGLVRLYEAGPRRSLGEPFLELDFKLEQDEERARLMQSVAFARETGAPFVSPPKTQLAREWFQEIDRNAAGEQTSLKALAEEIARQLAKARSKLDDAKTKVARILERAPQEPDDYATEKQRLDYARQLQKLDRELAPVREQAAKAEQEVVLLGKAQQNCQAKIAAWEKVAAWAQTKLDRLDEVEAKLRVHYRFYVMIGKREVELVRTTAFEGVKR